MMHVGGYDEYYRLRGEPPVEQDALDDLTTVLTSTYVITDTWWKGRVIRTVVTVRNAKGKDAGITTSGWLLPPRWVLPRRQLTTQSRTVSYGCTPAGGDADLRRAPPAGFSLLHITKGASPGQVRTGGPVALHRLGSTSQAWGDS